MIASTMSTPPPIPASYWLIDGMLLAGEYPGASSEARARKKLAKFLDAGILTYINLTETCEPLADYSEMLEELATKRGLAVKHVRYPICDKSIPEERELITAILAEIRSEISAGRPVYVHCWGGIGRTGTVIGCWLVEEGLAGPDAIARIAELREITPDRGRSSPETEEQVRFVCEWGAE